MDNFWLTLKMSDAKQAMKLTTVIRNVRDSELTFISVMAPEHRQQVVQAACVRPTQTHMYRAFIHNLHNEFV